MNRVRFAAAATLMAAGLVAGVTLAAQTPQAPPMTSVLAGKKLTPPIKGEAQVEFTACPGNAVGCTKRDKDTVVTTIPVKNVSSGPIARLAVDITWYDKGGAVVAGGKGVINGLLQPGEVQTVTIETPYDTKMQTNNFSFSHVNGTIKPKKVVKLEAGSEPAAAKK